MKSFILKTIGFSAVLFAIVTIFLNFGHMHYNTYEYAMWSSKIDYVESGGGAKNIILGDSRAVAGFVPELMQDDFYNLSLGGGTPLESYFFLKKYLEKNQVKKIIISFAPIHIEQSNAFLRRTLKYDLLSVNEIRDILELSSQVNENFIYDEDVHQDSTFNSKLDFIGFYLKSLLIHYKFPFYYRAELKASLLQPSRFTENLKVSEEIKQKKGNFEFGRADGSDGLNEEALRKESFKPSKIMTYYLHEIFSLARKKNIEVYYVNMPSNEASFNQISADYQNTYNEYFKVLKKKYAHVVWLEEFNFYKNEFFGDPSHLNLKGQKKFTKYINEYIFDNL